MSETQWLDIAKNISTVGFGPLMAIILVGGYFQRWVWGHQMRAAELREAKAVERAEFWQKLYLSRVTLIEKTLDRLASEKLDTLTVKLPPRAGPIT